MKAVETLKKLPKKMKRQLKAAILLTCAILTFAVPAFSGGYSILKTEHITSSAASVDGVDLLLVASSAFGEARKVMNASDPEAKDQFVANVSSLLYNGYKWQNMGLLLGPKDALSGTTWNSYQSPTTLSMEEIRNYGNPGLISAYEKYKAFGYAVQNLNASAKKSSTSSVSIEEGLDSMSAAALKLGNFGVEFLKKYNPAPVVLAFYDSSNLSTYSDNKLVQIVKNNTIMHEIVCLFGDKVANTGLSFFVILNCVVAIIGFMISMILTLLGNQNIGDGIRKFLIRIVIGTVGIYLIGNTMSIMLQYVGKNVLNVEEAENVSYIENNLNVYDWYLTGFSLPSDVSIKIDKSGQFQLNAETIKKINKYTYKRLTGSGGSSRKIRERMENYVQNGNVVTASLVTPSYGSGEGEAWATDVYYALMDNFANNKDLMENSDDESNALNQYAGRSFSITMSRYLWMSGLKMEPSGSGWKASGFSGHNFYGLNPISAFNLIRTEFSGNNIVATTTVYPTLSYVAYDAINVVDTSSDTNNMNAVLRFIAIFTIIMAALKGMITIFTAGFGGILAGGVKTAMGSSRGLGQAIGGIIAIFGGLIGISLILSVTMILLDALYGMAYDILGSAEILDSVLEPLQDAVGGIPFLGSLIMSICSNIVGFILTLIFSLTFPKLGGIPINVFCQYMSDLPGNFAERAQMMENALLSGRTSAGGGLGRGGAGGHQGGYGRMASSQASQAFSGAQRQAGTVVAGLAGAMGAMTGAGLSKLGKSLNKKADAVEGKPSNPGMDNWDELDPQQQTAAAAAAAEMGDDWNNMDQDARQKAMEDRMAAEQAQAQEATTTNEQSNSNEAANETSETSNEVPETSTDGSQASDGSMSGPVNNIRDMNGESLSMASGAQTNDSGSEVSGSGMNGTGLVSEVNSSSSVAGAEDTESAGSDSGVVNDQITGDSNGGLDAPVINETAGLNDKTDDADGMSLGEGTSGNENIVNNNNNHESIHAEQKVGNNIKTNAENKNVDNSHVMEEGAKNFNKHTDRDKNGIPTMSNGSVNGAVTGKGMGMDGMGLTAGQVAANQMNSTVNANANQTTKMESKQMDGSRSTNIRNGSGGVGNTESVGAHSMNVEREAKSNVSDLQNMNGTSQSAWGKEMSIKDQRKARIMHAVGDGLQMAGGNRSMNDGMRDAMGHLKNSAIGYTVPDEFIQNDFIYSVRSNRRQREERRRRQDEQ